MTVDPTVLSAVELATTLRDGRLTSLAVTDAFLARIERRNPHTDAVLRLHPTAREQAKAADAARAVGKLLGPLHGVPLTIKDGMRVGGVRTGFGFPGVSLIVKPGDCELVRRVRAAGAVVLGRTAIPLAMFDWQCRTPLGRECRNPHDPRHTPGGSSGGSAAALADRLTPLEIGSDLAGSIRYPAHCCGVVALRPTVGLLPTADVVPDGKTPSAPSAAVIGPMARTLPDLQLLTDVMLGDDDLGRAPPPPGDRLRLAVLPELATLPVDAPTRAAVADFIATAGRNGHTVTVLDRPPFDFPAAYHLWGRLVGYEMRQAFPAPLRGWPFNALVSHMAVTHRLGRGPLADGVHDGVRGTAVDYQRWKAEQAELWRLLDGFFGRFDLWALPVSPSSAIRRQPVGRPVRGHAYTHYLGAYTCPTAIAGTPAVVVPVGRDAAGLPIGLQVHGPRFADRWLGPAVGRIGAVTGHIG